MALNNDELQGLLEELEKHKESTFCHDNIKMELYEAKKNYTDAFRCLLLTSKPNRCLFSWIDKTISILENDPDDAKKFNDFTAVLRTQMRDIANSEYTLEKEELKQK